MTFLSPTWTLSGYGVAAHAVAEETHDPARKSGEAGAPCYSGRSTCSVRDKEGFLAASLSSPRASSSAVTRLSRGTPGSAVSLSVRTRRTTPRSPYSFSRPPLAPFLLARIQPSKHSSSGRPQLARSGTSCPCLGDACTRTTPNIQTDRTTLDGGARRSEGLRLRGISSSCRWLACEHSDQEPRSSYGILR